MSRMSNESSGSLAAIVGLDDLAKITEAEWCHPHVYAIIEVDHDMKNKPIYF